MITEKEYFSRNKKPIPATDIVPEHVLNAKVLFDKVNALWVAYEKQNGNLPLIVSSGYRTKAINASIKGSAKRSHHMMGNAVDIQDRQRILQRWLKTPAGLKALEDNGLYVEDFKYTKTWVHLQTVVPKSNNRFFIP
jgi:Peptidase M15